MINNDIGISKLYSAIKMAISETIESSAPTDYCYGKVIAVDPLQIQLEQMEILTEEFLTLTDAVRDYHVDIDVSHITENTAGGSGDASFEAHHHAYTGRKQIIVHNALTIGEEVVLLNQRGEQDYLVLSRRFDHTNLSGQWEG